MLRLLTAEAIGMTFALLFAVPAHAGDVVKTLQRGTESVAKDPYRRDLRLRTARGELTLRPNAVAVSVEHEFLRNWFNFRYFIAHVVGLTP